MKVDIEDLKIKMLVKYPFFGSVVANVKYREDPTRKTAATDGKEIVYNPNFLGGLSVEEQVFILAHEVCHIAFNHILRSEGKDPELWNVATDAVINQFLKRDGLKMVAGGVDIAEAINYDAEEYYNILLERKKNNQQDNQNSSQNNQGSGQGSGQTGQEQNQSGQGQNSKDQGQDQNQNGQGQNQQQQNGQGQDQNQNQNQNGQGQNQNQNQNGQGQNQEQQNQSGQGQNGKDQGQDQNQNGQGQNSQGQGENQGSHDLWEKAVKEKHEQEQQQKNGQGKSGRSLLDRLFNKNKNKDQNQNQNQNGQGQEKSPMEKRQEELEKMGERNAFDKNNKDKKKLLQEVRNELTKQPNQPLKQSGTGKGGHNISVGEVGSAKAILDWRLVLREAVKYDVDWSYQNATIEDGVLTPHLEEMPMPETEIVLDASGSVTEDLLRNFLRQCKAILPYSKIKVGCFDTEFHGFHEIRTEDDIENIPLKGSGGTDFNVAIKAFSGRVENKIIFTDGCSEMPDEPIDAIWIVFGDQKIDPKGGRVIYITPKQLEELLSYEVNEETKGRRR